MMKSVTVHHLQEAAMCSIPKALKQIKGSHTDFLPPQLIEQLCRQLHHRWRDRDLGPVITTHLFLQQVLNGNTAIAHLRHLSKLDFTDSAYCQARMRLPLAFFQNLQRAVTDGLVEEGADRP